MKMNSTSLESTAVHAIQWHPESKNDTLSGRHDLDCGEMTENFSENWMQWHIVPDEIFIAVNTQRFFFNLM